MFFENTDFLEFSGISTISYTRFLAVFWEGGHFLAPFSSRILKLLTFCHLNKHARSYWLSKSGVLVTSAAKKMLSSAESTHIYIYIYIYMGRGLKKCEFQKRYFYFTFEHLLFMLWMFVISCRWENSHQNVLTCKHFINKLTPSFITETEASKKYGIRV